MRPGLLKKEPKPPQAVLEMFFLNYPLHSTNLIKNYRKIGNRCHTFLNSGAPGKSETSDIFKVVVVNHPAGAATYLGTSTVFMISEITASVVAPSSSASALSDKR